MASLLCVKTTTGTVRVHSEEQVEDLAFEDDTEAHDRNMYMPRRPRSKPRKKPTMMITGTVDQRPSSEPYMTKQASALSCSFSLSQTQGTENKGHRDSFWVNKRQMQEMQAQALKDPTSFHWLCSPLLENEKTHVKDVSSYLDHKDLLDLRKRELLHKNWSTRVYQPIREKIVGAMHSAEYPDKDRRRRELHRQYLEHVNKKDHVFLDTMDAGEYYGQALNHHRPTSITVHTPNLDDPLLAQQRERNKEDQVILNCLTGQVYSHADIDQVRLPPLPLVPLGRHGTDSIRWLEMPLGNIESTPRRASRQRMRGTCTDTQIDFPQWAKLKFDASVLDAEMQLQKKRMFAEQPPYGVPARQFEKAPFPSTTTCSEQNAAALCAVNS